MRAPDGSLGYIPASRVHDAAAAGAKMVPLDAPDAVKASYWDALTNPVGSGGRDQGLVGGALQAGGQAIKTMAQPLMHPIDTLKGMAKTASDAVLYGPAAAAAEDVAAPMAQQYAQDRQQGGNALALENLGGQALGMVEGGRLAGAVASGVKPSPALGAAGETPVAGAEGPVNALGGANRALPLVARTGVIQPALNAAAALPGRLKGLIAGNMNAPIPGTAITPAARYASMTQMGLQPNAAEATNSTPLNMVERGNQNSLTSQPIYTNARAANLAALNRYATEGVTELSPEEAEAGASSVRQALGQQQAAALAQHDSLAARTVDNMSPYGAEEGGGAAQQGLKGAQTALQQGATEDFADLDRGTGGRKFPATDLQQTAQNILSENAAYYAKYKSLLPKSVWNIVRDVANPGGDPAAPRTMDFSEVQKLRSQLLQVVRNNPEIVKDEPGAWLQRLAEAADRTMTTGATGLNEAGTQLFRRANQAWAQMKGTYDNPSHPFYQAVRTPSPSTLVNGIQQTPEMAKMLQNALGPEGIGPIQRGVTEKLLGSTPDGGYDYKNFPAKWGKLPQEYKQALYTPSQIAQLDQLGADIARNPFYNSQSVPYRALASRDSSGLLGVASTPQAVEELRGMLGDGGLGPIQRGVAENLLRTTKEGGYNFKTFQGQWNKLPDEYKRTLFTPQQIQRFDDIGNAGTVLNVDPNPSGSAKLGQGLMEMGEAGSAAAPLITGHPLPLALTGAYHATQYALGKLMNSPKFVEWLMRDQGLPTAGAPSSGAAAAIPAAAAAGPWASGPSTDAYLRGKAKYEAAQEAARNAGR